MIFNQVFEKIFVINLKESTDRKKHIIDEFTKMKITNYEFFEATHYEDPKVKELYDSGKVLKFPPCFRCLKKRCSCENNFLTKFQIANWLSFIRLFEHILKNNYNFVCICEDDICFTKYAPKICNQLLSKHSFAKHNIQMKHPLLIKMGVAFDYSTHYYFGQTSFVKNYSLSNPCFALNKEMIYVFLSNLKIIDYHSDVYFHKTIPQHFGNKIQMISMKPYPVFELSFVKSIQKFNSLVRPKNQLRRKEYKEYLFITMTKLLEFIPSQYSKNKNLHILKENIGFNGSINYIQLNNNYNEIHYYFENKYFFHDNHEDDINLILNQINIEKNNYIFNILTIVNTHYQMNLNIYDMSQMKDNLIKLYSKILDYFIENGFKIICIQKEKNDSLKNDILTNDSLTNYINIKKVLLEKTPKLELNEEEHKQPQNLLQQEH
jgi:GR25 family glycosyltransferase involved in LPS biosynthesis